MLTFLGSRHRRCDGLTRRDFLQVGGLGLGGLVLADLLRLRAAGAATARNKSVVMVWLGGGPSHIDMVEPDAQVRGEFKPIATRVPGLDVCELLPLQAQIADKFTLIRSFKYKGDVEHVPFELLTGVTQPRLNRPSIGSVLSRVRGHGAGLPPYVSLMTPDIARAGWEHTGYLGDAHKPFNPAGEGLESSGLVSDLPLDRVRDRKALLQSLDGVNRRLDHGKLAGYDAFTARALDMVSSGKAREAFDLAREPDRVRARYGKFSQLLLALRLAAAGVPVVTTNMPLNGSGLDWDTHGGNFRALRRGLPAYDQATAALITDLYERGLDKDVLLVIWGEMGRTPKVNDKEGGRDHWYQAGFALVAGGGLPTGRVIGATDARAELITSRAYTPQNMLATIYRHLGIDPATDLITDTLGRPNHLLDDPKPIAELV